MFRREESVPFAFVAQSDRFRSNVAPPPHGRVPLSKRAGDALVGLVVVCGLVGSLLLGLPALDAQQRDKGPDRPAAAESR